MSRKLTLSAFAVAASVVIGGCDLNVTNPNQADRNRALASPADVETLISSAYATYWTIAHDFQSNAMAFNVMANHGSASWGNFGMNDLGRQPREALPNSPSYRWAYVFEVPWQDSYQAISAATDGIRAINDGLQIGPGGDRNARAMTFATFMQGLGHCLLGLWFDKGFTIDETTDITGDLTTVPYDQLVDFGMAKLTAAEGMAQGLSMPLEDSWINGNALTGSEFASLIRSYKARCEANQARSPSEAASLVNWQQVDTDAAGGLTLTVEGEDASTTTPWWDALKYYGVNEGTWNRMHMDFVGMGDVSGEYQNWLALPVADRNAFDAELPDLRFPQTNAGGEQGVYFGYAETIIFPAARGTYRHSHYTDERHTAYETSCVGCWFGPMQEIIQQELDLLQAEAAIQLGNTSAAVSLLNQTRVGNGGLPALVDAGTVPGGASCVPRVRFDPSGACGDINTALQWEHMSEMHQITGGLSFWMARRQGILPTGTAIHMPIPASDLEVLQEDIYTFGGGGAGSAPSIVPGNLTSSLERAAYSLEAVQRNLNARHRAPKPTEIDIN